MLGKVKMVGFDEGIWGASRCPRKDSGLRFIEPTRHAWQTKEAAGKVPPPPFRLGQQPAGSHRPFRQDHRQLCAVAGWSSNLLLELEVARGVAARVVRRGVEARRVAARRLVARRRVRGVAAGRCIAVAAGRRRYVVGDWHVLSHWRVAASGDRRVVGRRCTVRDRLTVADRVAAIAWAIGTVA